MYINVACSWEQQEAELGKFPIIHKSVSVPVTTDGLLMANIANRSVVPRSPTIISFQCRSHLRHQPHHVHHFGQRNYIISRFSLYHVNLSRVNYSVNISWVSCEDNRSVSYRRTLTLISKHAGSKRGSVVEDWRNEVYLFFSTVESLCRDRDDRMLLVTGDWTPLGVRSCSGTCFASRRRPQ